MKRRSAEIQTAVQTPTGVGQDHAIHDTELYFPYRVSNKENPWNTFKGFVACPTQATNRVKIIYQASAVFRVQTTSANVVCSLP